MKPWFERDPDRYETEREFWAGQGFSEERDGDDIVFRGAVDVTVAEGPGEPYEQHDFELTVRYLEGFPFVAPEVAFLDPPVRRHRHQSSRGKPCLFPDEAWHQDQKAGEFLKALRTWLSAYIVGRFPRELAIYELPEYLVDSGLTVLGPPGMDDAAEGATSGSFRVTELLGLDLAVVTELQGVDVGTDVLDGLRMRRAFKQQERVGTWYRLDAEPPPPQLLTELQDILKKSGHTNPVFPPRERPRLTALRFEDEVLGQPRWLFLDTGIENAKRPPRPHEREVLGATFYPVTREELFRRLQGVTDTDTLSDRIVTVFGLGAVGSSAALALAREAVGEFKLCDPDTLRPGNVIRHVLDLSDVGQPKATAVEAAIHRINPFVETSTKLTGLRKPEVMEEILNDAHLVISAIGDNTIEEQLNQVVVESMSQPPVLFARTLHAGDAIRVILFRPGRDACFTCLMLHKEDGHPDWVTVPASNLPGVHDDGCATAAAVGAGLASEHAGLLLARRATAVLTGRDGEANHWLWLERPVDGVEAQRMPDPGVLRADRFEPHPECPVCRG